MAHGADTIMFFQMRRSIGACEKYHGAVIDHVGTEHTRVFREIAQMGQELKKLGDKTLGARCRAKAAVLVDWDNWWGIEYSAGPSCDLKYLDEVFHYYRALEEQNYAVDLIGTEDELSQYEVVIAPILYMTKGDHDEKIRNFVKDGGTFVTTFFSGYVDENDLVITGGYPGKLRDILGIWVEESDALPADQCNHFTYQGVEYPAKLLCDLMHLEGADALSGYQEDFYAGMPVITAHKYEKGKAYYVGTRSSENFYQAFIRDIMEEKGISPVLKASEGVEATERFKGEHSYLFVLNHKDAESEFVLQEDRTELLSDTRYAAGQTVSLKPKDVMIFER